MRHDIDIDGRLISYLDIAAPGKHHAGTVLFLHAFPLDARMWEPQFHDVPSGWRFLAPDLRGFGRSSPDPAGSWTTGPDSSRRTAEGGPSIDDYARDVLALLDDLRLSDVVPCGLSMGGYVAFAIYRLAPRRVRGFVLADTRPDPDAPAARANRRQALETLARDGVAAVADGMLPRLLGRTSMQSRPAVVDHVREMTRAQSAAAVGPAILRLMTRPDSTPLLAGLDRPVLVIAGKEDEIAGPDVARQLHGQIAGADLALIGHAGHLSNLEQPATFNEALDRFLATRFIQP